MRCERAAIVEYIVQPDALDRPQDSIPEEVAVELSVHARIVRRLDSPDPVGTEWPDNILAPLYESDEITIEERRHVISADSSLWKQVQRMVDDLAVMVRQWDASVSQLTAAVPRNDLKKLVEKHVSEEGAGGRLGRQIRELLELPTTSDGLSLCHTVIEDLGRWAYGSEMQDMADQHYRLASRTEEDQQALRIDMETRYEAVAGDALGSVVDRAALGLCVPEEQLAFLDDTLFVFDGQFSQGDMRRLMAEYLDALEQRMTIAAVALDAQREGPDAERPSEIPERVRTIVWRRDMARCAVCGSADRLEFDHIIPRSVGGASTPGNLQVICQRCNDRKGAQVARVSSRRNVTRDSDTLALDLFRDAPTGRDE
jgi:5-methylcytosine-specific restriction endonuclease McrA